MKVSMQRIFAAAAVATALVAPAQAQDKVEITLARFFGSCEADWGKSTEVKKARGECAVITTLVNQFNATNKEGITVKTQVSEWGPYYDQLSARIVARDVPTVAVMHRTSLRDFASRKLLEPLDQDFKAAGIDVADFTAHARGGSYVDGKVYGLPFDTFAWLWHVNTNRLKAAGLAKPDGSPVVPGSAAELLDQARKYKQATGKPYIGWATSGTVPITTWTFLSLGLQQETSLFTDAAKPRLNLATPQTTAVMELINTLYSEGLAVQGADSAGINQLFFKGEVPIVFNGTWRIDDFLAQSEKSDSPLYKGYTVMPVPKIFARPGTYADGHSWVMVRGGAKNERERKAALSFLKFLWDNDIEWARTGHLPSRRSVIDSAEFKAMPYRSNIAAISATGRNLPQEVPRQQAVQVALNEELVTMLQTKKPVAQAQASAQTRVNKILDSVR
ncbi:Bacterial extracellular solute-binding protein [Xylophilus ampelinus]|nr:Bacterial extracellular solute-binding protein [Xylophilus ampelinus]